MNAGRQLIILGFALASALIPSPLLAQEEYPNKTIRVIMPFPAGRGADITTRQIVGKMAVVLGQQAVIENRPGASGIIGTEVAAKAPPDGYTLYAGPISTVAMVPYLYSKLPFDMERDFVAISQFTRSTVGVYAPVSSPVKNLQDLIDLSKKRTLNVASSGIGTNAHLYLAWFAMVTGANFNFIHYATTHWAPDLMAGRLEAASDGLTSMVPGYKAGKIRILAVSGKERHRSFPEVPTIAESGVPEFEPNAWTGLFAPTGVPRPIIEQLGRAVAAAAKSPELIEQYRSQATEPVGNTPTEFAAFVKAEQAKWSKIIRAAKIKLD